MQAHTRAQTHTRVVRSSFAALSDRQTSYPIISRFSVRACATPQCFAENIFRKRSEDGDAHKRADNTRHCTNGGRFVRETICLSASISPFWDLKTTMISGHKELFYFFFLCKPKLVSRAFSFTSSPHPRVFLRFQ